MSENPQQTALTVQGGEPRNDVSAFANNAAFENATRMAAALAKSTIVPQAYQGNTANTLVALEMANRMQVSPLMVMQNLDIIHGRPSFNAKFTVAMVNGTGKYSQMRYRYEGQGDARTCVAYCKELATGEVLEGPPCSIAMAKKEGWFNKSGSKWPSMPDMMLMYRAGTFWTRMYEPGLTMGMPTTDELDDIGAVTVQTSAPPPRDLNEKIASRKKADTTGTAAEQSEKKHEPEEATIIPDELPPGDDDFLS